MRDKNLWVFTIRDPWISLSVRVDLDFIPMRPHNPVAFVAWGFR
jgi:hypothetical protein